MTMRLLRILLPALLIEAASAAAGPTLSTAHSFGIGATSGANPSAELIEGSDGALYGTTSTGGSTGQGTLFRINKDGSGYQVLRTFGLLPGDGTRPVAALIEGSDGLLYGTTDEGGPFGYGTVFRSDKAGANFSLLKSFTGADDGANPEARLLQASDGLLYGTTSGGGLKDSGTVFRLAADGSVFQTLASFAGTNGANPEGALLEASDGQLYGTTSAGGNTNVGTFFRLNKDGSAFTVLKHLVTIPTTYGTLSQTNGTAPYGGLIEATNGSLFALTSAGGTNTTGTLLSLNKDGTGYRVVYQFGAYATTNARTPAGELLQASDGRLYGTTLDGGASANGTVFRIDQSGSNYTVLARLSGIRYPAAGLLEASDGALYGTTQFGGDFGAGAIFKLQKDGSGFTVLHSFAPAGGDGQSAYATVARGNDGLLYGSTRLGGAQGAGAVFAVRFDGRAYRLLASLAAPEGFSPLAALVQGTNGNLFGSTQFGAQAGNGAIFALQTDGTGLAPLYAFPTSGSGQEPCAALIQGSDGGLYGTTMLGGSGGRGAAFRMNVDGSGYTVLHSFTTGTLTAGQNPMQPLLEGSDHKLYGTLYSTAFSNGLSNNGAVFSLSRDGLSYSLLKAFVNPITDGASPMSPLLEASDGMLYGTTYGGGATNNAGTVYRLNKDGSAFQIIHSFTGVGADGRHPCGNLLEGTDGAIYGTTERGGTNDQGTLFSLDKDGSSYAVLAGFGAGSGQYPRGGLVLGSDGAFYGTTDQGGSIGFGTVFRYGSPLEEIVDFQLTAVSATLTCIGLPGTNYWIERTSDLTSPANWTPIYSTNSPADGNFQAVDLGPLPGTAFYRLRR